MKEFKNAIGDKVKAEIINEIPKIGDEAYLEPILKINHVFKYNDYYQLDDDLDNYEIYWVTEAYDETHKDYDEDLHSNDETHQGKEYAFDHYYAVKIEED